MGRRQWRWGQKSQIHFLRHWGRGADSDDVLSGYVEGVRAGLSQQQEPRFHTDGKMKWDCRLSMGISSGQRGRMSWTELGVPLISYFATVQWSRPSSHRATIVLGSLIFCSGPGRGGHTTLQEANATRYLCVPARTFILKTVSRLASTYLTKRDDFASSLSTSRIGPAGCLSVPSRSSVLFPVDLGAA